MGALVRLILVAEYRTDHLGKRRIGEWFDSIGYALTTPAQQWGAGANIKDECWSVRFR